MKENKQIISYPTSQPIINVAGMQLPQKVYRLPAYDRCAFLFGLIFILAFLAAFAVASFIPDGLTIWARITFAAMVVVSLVIIGWMSWRMWSQRLEFSADGILLDAFFCRIYAPWANIVGFEKQAKFPHYNRQSYGGFVYKEPALLYVPLRLGKEEQRTVVQIPRLRARTNPNIVAYLSHYLPIFPEFFPEKDLPLLQPMKRTTTDEHKSAGTDFL